MTDIKEMQEALIGILKSHVPPLKIRHEEEAKFEVAGTIEAMQGKQKVDGFYFGSVVPKPKDVRLYFFPAYTHADEFQDLPEQLKKCLKGKSCFHIKKLDESLRADIESMVAKGIQLYQKDGVV